MDAFCYAEARLISLPATAPVLIVCSAIMSSSSVGITKTVVGEFLALMIWALARFASASMWISIHSMPVRTASRTFHACSPMPAVKTTA